MGQAGYAGAVGTGRRNLSRQPCEDFGAPIVPSRVALGALVIKERLRLTDRETVETIRENPYLQFFIGKPEFTQTHPLDASLMVDFRKRFGETGMQQIAQAIALKSLDQQPGTATCSSADQSNDDDSQPPDVGSGQATALDEATSPESADESPNDAVDKPIVNRGRLLSDASCAPADTRYPTDVSLPNEARDSTKPARKRTR